jgi:hypothetical protein
VPREVYDLVQALTPGPLAVRVAPVVPPPVITAFLNLNVMTNARNWLVAPPAGGGPAPALNDVQDLPWLALSIGWGVLAGGFGALPPSARLAAELYRLCVSDHLPVLFRMQL